MFLVIFALKQLDEWEMSPLLWRRPNEFFMLLTCSTKTVPWLTT